MKHLYLVRHAKSSWSNQGQPDFERPLNDRGRRDVITMGERLKNKIKIDVFISSSAARTNQTSLSLANSFGFDLNRVQFYDELYHASPRKMLNVINDVDDKYESLIVVGHNPGISMLCDDLCNYSVDFPTLAIAKITFETDKWAEIFNETGALDYFDFPKNLNL